MVRGWVIGIVLICSPAFAGDKYALLIGISKYDHAEMNKPEPLKFPEVDAKAVGKVLKEGGYEVEILLGKSATRFAIEMKLSQLAKRGSADGIVLIGLFGHGVEIETRGDDNSVVMEGCFCPFNTELRVVKDGKGRNLRDENGQPLIEPDPASLIKLSDLMISLKLAKAGDRVVLADCCRTVANKATGRSFGTGFRAQDLPDSTSVLFGCSPNEKAFEHEDWGHGAFTKCLLGAIAELSESGDVNTAGLAGLLKKRVPELVRSVSPRDQQTPKLFSTDLVNLQLTSLSPPKRTNALPLIVQPPSTPEAKKFNSAASRAYEGSKAGDAKELLTEIKFRWCPAGKFMMGHTEAKVKVYLSSGFWLGETEITQGQWQKVMRTTPWSGQQQVREGNEFAASYVSHQDAVMFCETLTTQERKAGRLPIGWEFTLPTEAQWEYACRTATTSLFSFGDNESQLENYSWFEKNTWNSKERFPHRVGQKKPNLWGLRDMHGNVHEWCIDLFTDRLEGGRNPAGASTGSFRVNRGGGWSTVAAGCGSGRRYRSLPDVRAHDVGFRLASVRTAQHSNEPPSGINE